MKTTTVRVPAETRDRLNELARRRGAPAGDPEALAAYRADTRELEGFDAPLPDY
jgi:predicted DNA-binding protein